MSVRPARPRVEWRTVDGILLLDKPLGLSSNQALQRARRLYRAAKAGHTGSLDPLATGVLPLCFGHATKVAGLLLDSDKTYRARLALGRRTDTGDREGGVVETRPVPPLDRDGVIAALARFVGELEQVPPMYSALKRNGEALYSLARRGIEVDRVPRRIRILRLNLVCLDATTLEFSVTCSKGTYVRTLGEDIAAALGTCGHLEALERTEVGAFAGEHVHSFEELERIAPDEHALDALLAPVDSALRAYPAVALSGEQAERFRHGQSVATSLVGVEGLAGFGEVRVYDDRKCFLGLGAADETLAAVRATRLMCGDSSPRA
jgi:tRNA pseudouridine55 synthase